MTSVRVFVYRLSQEQAAVETMQQDSEELNVASHIILPAIEFEGLWENLYFDPGVKENVSSTGFNYVKSWDQGNIPGLYILFDRAKFWSPFNLRTMKINELTSDQRKKGFSKT